MNAEKPVVVVGAGVVGLSVALQLRLAGLPVVVLESATVGSGASHANAGWLTPALSAPIPGPGVMRYAAKALLDRRGPFSISAAPSPRLARWALGFARASTAAAHEAGTAATARLAAGVTRSFADLQRLGLAEPVVRHGMLIVFGSESEARASLADYRALSEFGVSVPSATIGTSELRRLEPALAETATAGIYFQDQAHIDPLKLTLELARLAREAGVTIRERTRVRELVRGPSGTRVRLDDGGGTVDGQPIVVCAGVRSAGLLRGVGYRLPMQAGKGYSFSVTPAVLPRIPVYLPAAKLATTPLGTTLRIAGVMQLGARSLSISKNRLAGMRRSAETYFDGGFVDDPSAQWAGLRPVTSDGLPVFGRVPTAADVFVASGHAMLGVTLGPLTGELIAQQVLGAEPGDVAKPFSPARF